MLYTSLLRNAVTQPRTPRWGPSRRPEWTRYPSAPSPTARRTQEVSMAKGYWVSVYRTISDPEKLAAYNKLAGPAVQAGGGRRLAVGGRVVAHDAGIAERTVLIEFDTFEQAGAARESAAYPEA